MGCLASHRHEHHHRIHGIGLRRDVSNNTSAVLSGLKPSQVAALPACLATVSKALGVSEEGEPGDAGECAEGAGHGRVRRVSSRTRARSRRSGAGRPSGLAAAYRVFTDSGRGCRLRHCGLPRSVCSRQRLPPARPPPPATNARPPAATRLASERATATPLDSAPLNSAFCP